MRIKSEETYSKIEKCLVEANKSNLISCNKRSLHETKTRVEQIIRKLVSGMSKQSPTFSKLYYKIFGVGSVYEQTKIGKPDEFDIDIVFKIPEILKPVLKQENAAGFVQMQLENFRILAQIDPEMHRTMSDFVDSTNYLLSEEMMLLFFRKTFEANFPNRILKIGDLEYNITKIEYVEPALTLTIEGLDFLVSVDLVASFLLSKDYWPKTSFRKNPSLVYSDFFLAPARPIEDRPHKERFWRLSFHMQEREIIFNKQWLKPAMRILKRIRDHYNQAVHSYAIKTLFLWELDNKRSTLHPNTSLGYIIIYMLEKYLKCLSQRNIPCFWNQDLNLLSYLSKDEVEQCRKQIAEVLNDLRKNPKPEVLLKYLK